MKYLILVLISVIVFVGCTYTKGAKVDQSTLDSLHQGSTTFDQAVATLGKPDSVSLSSNGKMATYTYHSTTSNPNPIKFIPIVGSIAQITAGGDKVSSDSQMITLMFDKNDKLLFKNVIGGTVSATSKSALESAYDGLKESTNNSTIKASDGVKQVGQ